MDFKPMDLESIDRLRPYFSKNLCRICDCTIGGTYIWRDLFKTQYAIVQDNLFLKVEYLTGTTAFTPPRGDPRTEAEAYERIVAYCREIDCPPRLCAVSEPRLESILSLYPAARATSDRAWSDYLYRSEDIRSLAGRRYSGQRNHMNKFRKNYPDWSFEALGPDNLAEIRAFFRVYAEDHLKDYPAYDEGNIKTLEVLDNLDRYRLLGGALKVGGAVVGASLGEVVDDTLFVHVEKSKTEYAGSYPMLVNQFAQAFAGPDVTHINREEDDGVAGLRISKMSYHPTELLHKYVVELE